MDDMEGFPRPKAYMVPADEYEALLADAGRYRWLREQNWSDSTLFVVAGGQSSVMLGTDCPSLFRLDEAIDDAISKTENPSNENLASDGR